MNKLDIINDILLMLKDIQEPEDEKWQEHWNKPLDCLRYIIEEKYLGKKKGVTPYLNVYVYYHSKIDNLILSSSGPDTELLCCWYENNALFFMRSNELEYIGLY